MRLKSAAELIAVVVGGMVVGLVVWLLAFILLCKIGMCLKMKALPKHEHAAILELVRANNLPESQLACHMTRQTG